MKQSSQRLFDLFHEQIPHLRRHGFDDVNPQVYAGANVWLLSALLQKAIRRGDVQAARRAGHQLLAVDPSRLWRRLMVVGLEDIGIGNCDTAVALVSFASIPELRRLAGGNGAALDIAVLLGCEAVKDRAGDGFCSIAREMKESKDHHSLEDASDNARLAVLSSSYLDWRRRLRAALLLAEVGGRAAERALAFSPISELFRALGIPDGFMDACEVYRFKSDDPLSFFVPLVFSLWLAAGGKGATVSHLLPPVELIGGIPDYAFDPLHTRIGRRAVELWLHSYLERPPFTTQQVAAGLWIVESGACDKTLVWPLGAEIAEQAVLADMARVGLSGIAALKTWIERERPVLTCARKAAWESAARATSGTQQGVLGLAAAAE